MAAGKPVLARPSTSNSLPAKPPQPASLPQTMGIQVSAFCICAYLRPPKNRFLSLMSTSHCRHHIDLDFCSHKCRTGEKELISLSITRDQQLLEMRCVGYNTLLGAVLTLPPFTLPQYSCYQLQAGIKALSEPGTSLTAFSFARRISKVFGLALGLHTEMVCTDKTDRNEAIYLSGRLDLNQMLAYKHCLAWWWPSSQEATFTL